MGTIILEIQGRGDWLKVRNGGGLAARRFLEDHSHLFARMSDGPAHDAHALEGHRMNRFVPYAQSKGLTVKVTVGH